MNGDIKNKLEELRETETMVTKRIEYLNKTIRESRDTLNNYQEKLRDIRLEKTLLLKENPQIEVTEHALFRYCQRVIGIDMDDIKREILESIDYEQYRVNGSGKYDICAGSGLYIHTIVIKDNKVITIE